MWIEDIQPLAFDHRCYLPIDLMSYSSYQDPFGWLSSNLEPSSYFAFADGQLLQQSLDHSLDSSYHLLVPNQ